MEKHDTEHDRMVREAETIICTVALVSIGILTMFLVMLFKVIR